ncbi:FAD-dependent oxidoreductase [Flammeovirgaceae bacterium SG7u.111]|nr:FAD-dependent oxidoreductase [Flammeovirgaceae bacterium SG7u.132]WPO35043.1 FAD-dependent oxidoreductase [Flammeovirgaceae bacterium SG7u.111]
MDYDYILVGQGIAGTVLAESLFQVGKSVLVVDNGAKKTSSRVAAGIFNPITGRRMNKTWVADELFPKLFDFYPTLEIKLGKRFFYQKNVYHPFDSQEKQNYWMAESADSSFADYIKGFDKGEKYKRVIKGEFGGMLITKAGFVDIPVMLDVYRAFLIEKKCLLEKSLSIEDVKILPDGVEWQNIRAGKMIFCEGTLGEGNPYFDWLRFKPVKGELLLVDFKNQQFEETINRGCWILPHHDGLCRIGATYDNYDMSLETTELAKEKLLEKLTALVSVPFEIKEQRAGIRPATYDRRPFVGLHPEHPSIGVFNGLGAKGISLSPWCAELFVNQLEKGNELPKEIDIRRVLKRKG